MNQQDFINKHTSTPYYTAEINGPFLFITFLVYISATLYTAFGHHGKFKSSVLKVRLSPVPETCEAQRAQLDALLTKLHKKPNIKVMKLETLETTFFNACKTNDEALIAEIQTLPVAQAFTDAHFFVVAASQSIPSGNLNLFKTMFCRAYELCAEDKRKQIDDELCISGLISDACAYDNPAVISYLVDRFPHVDLHEEYDRFFYRAVYQKSWQAVAWFFENKVMTLSTEVENRITNKLTNDNQDPLPVIKHLRSISLKFKLDAELPCRDDDEEEDTPFLKI